MSEKQEGLEKLFDSPLTYMKVLTLIQRIEALESLVSSLLNEINLLKQGQGPYVYPGMPNTYPPQQWDNTWTTWTTTTSGGTSVTQNSELNCEPGSYLNLTYK